MKLLKESDSPLSLDRIRPADIIDVNSAESDPGGATGIADYLRMLKRRKWTVLAFCILGIAGGFAAVVMQPPLYRARTTLEIQGLNERFMNIAEVDPQAGAGNYSATDANLQTQIKIIESNLLRNRSIEKLERQTIPLAPPQNDIFAVLRGRLKLVPREPLEATRLAVQKAAVTLSAGVVRATRIVEIRADSYSPEVAATMVNLLANEYIDQTVEARVKSTQRTREWLSQELADLKTKLETSESRLQLYVRNAKLVFVEQQNTLADAKLKQLQTELSTIQADRIAKQARFEMATKSSSDSLPDVLDDGMLRNYQTTSTDLHRQLADLSATLQPEHPKVQKIQAQIAEVEAAQKKVRENILQRIRNDFDAAQRRESLLDSAYNGQSRQVSKQAERELEYNILKRELDINRQMYNTTLEQVNQAELASGIPNSNVRVLDIATSPELPFRPQPVLSLSVGLGSGLLLGSCLVIWRGRMDRSLKDPGHAARLLRVPELTVIPNAAFSPFRRPLFTIGRRPRPKALDVTARRDTPSLLAESFRVCLPSLLNAQGSSPKVIVVTSPAPGEGKTTCAANLAIAIAETNRRVLLVDADFRSPRLHEIFGVTARNSLADIIMSDRPLAEFSLDSFAQLTEVENLCIAPCAPAEVNISRLHYSPRITELFAALRDHFDMVIVDTPPMLQFFDARALAQLSDGVVLVFRAGSTDRAAAIAASRRLEEDGTPLLGTILNDWDPSTAEAKAYHRYYRQRAKHAKLAN